MSELQSGTRTIKHLPAGSGRSFAMMGSALTFKDEPADNGDALMAFEHHCPSGLGVPPHTERNHEAFYVLEGTLEVDAEGERYRLGPGDFLSIPPGVTHALLNPGPGALRVLTIVAPGSGHERFFTTLGEPIEDPANPPHPSTPPDFERVSRIAQQCGIDFLPPGGDGDT
jgi:quercetin dioxygenase-like cupin family protein